jgi:hypothetical protein
VKGVGRSSEGAFPRGVLRAFAVSALAAACLGAGGVAEARSRAHAPSLRPGPLVVVKGKAIQAVAADRNHLVWETAPLEGGDHDTREADKEAPALVERRLDTGATRVLATNVEPHYGLASTANWVVYALPDRRLIAVAHGGSRRIVLSTSLLAPLAARGELVAWAERDGDRDRVVVRDMSGRRPAVILRMKRCELRRCYQIEAVTLAERGVVVARDGTDPDGSFIVRLAFSDRTPTQVAVPDDPQPDLVPSSAGALYYALGRGWYRWDFGEARPHRTGFAANPPATLLGYEQGIWFLATQNGCTSTVVAVDRGRRRAITSAQELRALDRATSELCVTLAAFNWTGRQVLTGWALSPQVFFDAHSDFELAGVALGSDVLR